MALNLCVFRSLGICAIFVVLFACTGNKTTTNDKIKWQQNTYARLFKIGSKGKNQVLFIYHPLIKNKIIQKFYRGSQVESGKDWQKIDSCQSLAVSSCVIARFVELLGEAHRIVAVDNLDYYSSEFFRKNKNHVTEFIKSNAIQFEKLASLHCDILIQDGMFKNLNSKMLQKIDLPTLFFQNHLESHPLGSAEWIKVMAFMLGTIDNSFDRELNRYLETRKEVAKKDPINVLVNAPYRGVWYIPKENSPLGALMRDAGAKISPYMTGTGSASLTMEQVFSKSGWVKFWFTPNFHRSKASISAEEPRMNDFKAFENVEIFNNTKQMVKSGANNYYESFNTEPSLILKDIIAIIHKDRKNLLFFEAIE
jgi:iron complex transport system substrate-binding protein